MLNAFRHPRRSPPRGAAWRRRQERRAQRLPASPPITTLEDGHAGLGAARVLNAFRHPRRSPPPCTRPDRPRRTVLNAFRHPRRSPRVDGEQHQPEPHVLNAFRHPRRSPHGGGAGGGDRPHVLNAFRHPRRSPPAAPVRLVRRTLCSTPSGIPADHHQGVRGGTTRAPGAQRLPASPPITTRRGRAGAWGAPCAQRLPASPPITTRVDRPHDHLHRRAQRLPASPPITTMVVVFVCERLLTCSTPSGIPADHHTRERSR